MLVHDKAKHETNYTGLLSCLVIEAMYLPDLFCNTKQGQVHYGWFDTLVVTEGRSANER